MLGLVGLAPVLLGVGDALAALSWIALVAPAVGVAVGGAGVTLWPFGLVVPSAWMIGIVLVDAAGGASVPRPVWGALAFTGLVGGGVAIGLVSRRDRVATRAALVLLVCALLALLPLAGATRLLGGRTWGELSPALAARLFDASPITLVLESAGVDWMRHAAVYEAAGSEWFSDRRAPYRGGLAGPLSLVVGCAPALIAGRRSRRAAE